jgi:hypothetical protein
MLDDRTQRLNQLGADHTKKINAMTQIKVGSYKLGDDTTSFVYVSKEEVQLKSTGTGMLMAKSGTSLAPGRTLTMKVPFNRCQYNTDAFHVLSREPSSAILPHGVFDINYAQAEDIAEFTGGILAMLTEAAEFFSG